MKSRVKSKADTNKTGNKKVILKPREEELLNFIDGDTDNPAIVRLKGAVTAGTEETQNENSVSFDSSVDSTNFETSLDKTTENRQGKTQDSTAEQRKVTGPNVKQAKKKLKLIETEETKDLTLPELQRLVLLKQLEYFKKLNNWLIYNRNEKNLRNSISHNQQHHLSKTEFQQKNYKL
ncbi:hypothetical protein J6590_031977 [Homalodisca vitripennis]|nr:hypothetical protein J6590_031977 [Homalodisca vitripennis]